MALSDRVKERMRGHVVAAQKSMEGGGGVGRFPTYDLTGKNAIVEPGQSVLGRVLPRWDIADKFVYDEASKQWTVNEAYEDDFIYFIALEHWWDDPQGKPQRAYCPKTFDQDERCPICDASDDLQRSGSGDDRKVGKRIAARRVYLFNFVVGRTGKRALTEGGKPDIRVLSASNVIFSAIASYMTGGIGPDDDARSVFARGDISDPREGFDLKLDRPSGKTQGERWKVDCAPKPTPLHSQEEAGAWGGWMDLLVDIPSAVAGAVRSYADLYEAYYGQPPSSDGDEPAGGEPAGVPSPLSPPPDPRSFAVAAALPAAGSPPADPWGPHVGPAMPVPQATAPGPSVAPFDPPTRRTAAPRRPSARR